MKVLFVSNMYPTQSHSYYGIHVKEQIDALEKKYEIKSSLCFINSIEKGNLEYLKSIFLIRKLIKKDNPSVIHIHYGLSGLFLLFFRPKCKIFLTLHGGDILPKQGKHLQIFLTKRILKKADKVFALNSEMSSILTKIIIPHEILPCGVDTDLFKPNDKTNITVSNCKTLIFPGDPSRPVKNYKLFENVIKVLAKEKHIDLNIQIIHNLSRPEVVNTLTNGDCLVMTSLSEGSPQIVKESLFCNLPVVSVPVGDVKDVLKDMPGCFVTKNHSVIELSESIIKSLNTDHSLLRKKFIAKGIYDNDSIIKRIYNIYKST